VDELLELGERVRLPRDDSKWPGNGDGQVEIDAAHLMRGLTSSYREA